MILTTSWKVHCHIIFQQLLWFVVAFFLGSRGVCIFCKMGFAMMNFAKKNLHVGGVYVFNHMGSSSPMVGGMQVMAKLSLLVCCIKSS